MTIVCFIKQIWKKIVFFLSLISAIITIYLAVRKHAPNCEFVITSSVNVLDVDEQLSGLEILLNGINIRETNENLKLVTLKVQNSGNENITPNLYDEGCFGVGIERGKIMDAPAFITSQSKYLAEKLSNYIFYISDNKIHLPKIMLDKGDSYTIRIIILHQENTLPQIYSIGKISGQSNIEIKNDVGTENSPSIWEICLYIFAALGGSFVLAIITSFMQSATDNSHKRWWKREIDIYKSKSGIDESDKHIIQWFLSLEFNHYTSYYEELYSYKNLIEKPDLLDYVYRLSQEKELYKSTVLEESLNAINKHMQTLLQENIIKVENNHIIVDQDLKNAINRLLDYFIDKYPYARVKSISQ